MLARAYGEVGKPVKLSGYATDFGHRIVAVEFSLNDGVSWSRYDVEDANDYQRLNWHFAFTPQKCGLHVLKVRSVNDEGRTSPEPDSIEILVDEPATIE